MSQRFRIRFTGSVLVLLAALLTFLLSRSPLPSFAEEADLTSVTAALITAPATIDGVDKYRFRLGGLPWYPIGYYPALDSVMTNPASYYQEIINDMSAQKLVLMRQVLSMGQPYPVNCAPSCPPLGNGSLIPVYNRSTTPGATGGGNKFIVDSANGSHFNNAAFQRMADVVAWARDKDVVVIVSILDGWHNNHPDHGDGWGRNYDYYNGPNNVNGVNITTEAAWHDTNPNSTVYKLHKALIQKTVDMLGTYPNIIWEVCNESGQNTWENSLATELYNYETLKIQGNPAYVRHLIMPRDLPGHLLSGGNDNAIKAAHTELINKRATYNKPLIADNDGGAGALDADGKRRKAWAALTAGAHILNFGYLLKDIDVWNASGTPCPPEVPPGTACDHHQARNYMGHLRTFLAGPGGSTGAVNLHGMKPEDSLVNDGLSGWAYARYGDEYIVYVDATPAVAGKTPELGNSGLWPGTTMYTVKGLPTTANSFTAHWFNPRTGAWGASLQGNGPNFTFSVPSNNDWVLRIKNTTGIIPPRLSAPTPASATRTTGGSVTFSASLLAGTSPSYVWQFKASTSASYVSLVNNARFSGVNTPTLTITGLTTADTGSYRLIASNSNGSANSGPATLTVN